MALVTTQSKPFMQLVQLQQQSLDALNTIKDAVSQTADSQNADIQASQLDVLQRMLDVQKNTHKIVKKQSEQSAKELVEIINGLKTFRTVGDRLKGFASSISDAMNPQTLKKALFGAFNVGGMFNKKIQEQDFVKRQKAWGVQGSDKDHAANYKKAYDVAKQMQANNAALEKWKKSAGLGKDATDDQISKSPQGAALLKKKTDLAGQYATYDKAAGIQSGAAPQPASSVADQVTKNVVAALKKTSDKGSSVTTGNDTSADLPKTPSDSGQLAESTTDMLAKQQAAHESQLESLNQLQQQTDLLQQIANNTANLGGGNNSSAGGAEDGSGSPVVGMMGGLGLGLKALGSGLGALGQGAGKGIAAILTGIAQGLAAFANPATIAGLAAVSVSVLAIGKALQWATPFFEAITPVLLKVADVVQNVFVTALQMVPDIVNAVGGVIQDTISAISDAIVNVIDAVTNSVSQLADIDAGNLAAVGGGLIAIAGGLTAFAAANVAAGIGNLVTNFLSGGGGGSPIDQLISLADNADNLNRAADGIAAIAEAMKGFSNIDKKSMDAINDFPWVRATAFVAAGGAMSIQGNKVYNQSKGNADESAKVDAASKAPQAATISTAVQNNKNSTTVVKPNIRNQESSQAKYLESRY